MSELANRLEQGPNGHDDAETMYAAAERLRKLEAVREAADKSYDEIQLQLEKQEGSLQFEFYSPEIDMHNHIALGKALAACEEQSEDGG